MWADELYLEMHRGTQTSKGELKKMNRRAEAALREAEILATAAEAFESVAAPRGEIDEAWKALLECHFHDAVTGTHCEEAGREIKRKFEDVLEATRRITAAARKALAPGGGQRDRTVFNVTGVAQAGHVAWKHDGDVTLAAGGRVAPTQRLRDGGLVTFVRGVPALGQKTFTVVKEPPSKQRGFEMLANGMRSEAYEITFDAQGRVERLVDRRNGREVLSGPGNEFRLFEDKPGRFEAWEISKDYERRPVDAVRFVGMEDGENGPLLASKVLRWRIGDSDVRQEVTLYAHTPRIDFRTEVDWREERKLLRVYFPLNVLCRHATYEIAYGTIERATKPLTPFEEAKYEAPFHRWFDAAEAGYGVAVLNDGKYGGVVRDGVASMSLLKSPRWPDPTSDLGKHEFTYSLLPHEGHWQEAGVFEEAVLLNSPLALVEGAGPAERAYLSVSRPGVMVEALKAAEDGDGWILRLVDYFGRRGRVKVTLPGRPGSVEACNVMEEPTGEQIEAKYCSFEFEGRPFGIHTFRIRPAEMD